MSEQELEDATQPKPGQVEESLQQADDELAFPDLKRGTSWGESITKKRAAELETKLQRWRTGEEHEKHRSPFSYEKLTGADLYWWVMREIEEVSQIVADTPASVNTDIESYVLNLPLEGAWLDE